MNKVQGLTLNIEKSSPQGEFWYLYFNKGIFVGPGIRKDTEDFILRLSKKEETQKCTGVCGYQIYFNPLNNKWTVLDIDETCHDYGYHVGGFVVDSVNCRLVFMRPKVPDCDITEYRRDFDEDFDEGYNQLSINCETPQEILDDVCGQFLEENFTEAYDVNCIVLEEKDQFKEFEFRPSFEIPTSA
jgi:hypothetical protein